MKQIVRYLKLILKYVLEFRENETIYIRETVQMKSKIDVLLVVTNELAKKVDKEYAEYAEMNSQTSEELRVIGFQPEALRAKATDAVPNSKPLNIK